MIKFAGLLLLLIFTFGLLFASHQALAGPSTLGGALEAASAVHFTFEDWRHDARIRYEYAHLRDGSWWNFRERDGLTSQASADVSAWAQSILDMPTTGNLMLNQPPELDLNAADDTPTTVGHTPVDFCAWMLFDSGAFFGVCVDETANGDVYAAIYDATSHQDGFIGIDPASVKDVFKVMPQQ